MNNPRSNASASSSASSSSSPSASGASTNPTAFRRDICRQVLALLASGESCSLIGVGSSGKSNVARHLLRRDVRELHLGPKAQGALAVLVDCMKSDTYTMASLHRLVLQALLNAIRQNEAELNLSGIKDKIATLCDRAMSTDSSDSVRYFLEEALRTCFDAPIRQIYIMLDDFDHMLANLPGNAINSLRALRDNYKNRLMYVAVTRRELAFIREEKEYEDFAEIVGVHPIAVGLFDRDDADHMIDTLARRYEINSNRINMLARNYLRELSGCHPGLLKALLNIMRDHPYMDISQERDQRALYGDKNIEPECQKIWESMEEEEHTALLALQHNTSMTHEDLQRLQRKRIIVQNGLGKNVIFSPLFADFVAQQEAEANAAPAEANSPASTFAAAPVDDVPPIQVNLFPNRLAVTIDGYIVRNLSQIEYDLFCALHQRIGQVVNASELAAIVAQRSTLRHLSDEDRVESHMDDLIHKVNVFGPQYISRGRNVYRLNKVV